jgi:hypothetical protein
MYTRAYIHRYTHACIQYPEQPIVTDHRLLGSNRWSITKLQPIDTTSYRPYISINMKKACNASHSSSMWGDNFIQNNANGHKRKGYCGSCFARAYLQHNPTISTRDQWPFDYDRGTAAPNKTTEVANWVLFRPALFVNTSALLLLTGEVNTVG